MIFVRQVEGEHGKIHAFLKGARSEYEKAVIPVAASPGSLKIVGLGGENAPQPGTAPDDIHDDTGKFSSRDIADPFGHQ
jgi:hypothetical protein